MNNKVLITQFIVGPTYKERIKYNLRTYIDSYKYFDVIILTDDVPYFDSIDMPNVRFLDVDDIRYWQPWSKEYEKLPIEKRDEASYGAEFIFSAIKIPTLMRRFIFNLPDIDRYCGYIFMDADVIPIATVDTYYTLEDFFCNATTHPEFGGDIKDKICVIPGIEKSYDEENHAFLYEYACKINEKYKVCKEVKRNFILTDGNFRCIKFGDKSQIYRFYELLNNVILDIYRGEYWVLASGIIWNLQSEYILSIIFNLLDAVAYPMTQGTGLHPQSCFRIDSYPEDRYFHNGLGYVIADTKAKFIDINYDRLKEHYESRGQEWPYRHTRQLTSINLERFNLGWKFKSHKDGVYEYVYENNIDYCLLFHQDSSWFHIMKTENRTDVLLAGEKRIEGVTIDQLISVMKLSNL